MIGTEASERVEQLLGVTNDPHIEPEIRCDPGSSSVTVRFTVQDDDMLEEIAREEEVLLEDSTTDDSYIESQTDA